MNHLAALKEKLMIKPNVEERERVAVVIKGVKNERKPKPTIEKEEGELSEQDEDEEQDEEPQAEKLKGPLFVDETQKGYDRKSLMKKLAESKKIKVTVKSMAPIIEEKETSLPKPLAPPTKKVKKIQPKTLIIEDDGIGVPQSQRAAILGRGVRLDERMPGSGLGLSIVSDMMAS